MSESTRTSSPSLINPIATPATAAFTGTPASISERDPPHTAATEEEPFDSRPSATIESPSLVDDRLAHDLLLQAIEQPGNRLRPFGDAVAEARDHLVAHCVESGVALVLAGLRERDAKTRERGVAEPAIELDVHAR